MLTAMVVSQSPPPSPVVTASVNCPVSLWGTRIVSRLTFQTGISTKLQSRIRMTRAVAVSHESPTRLVIAFPARPRNSRGNIIMTSPMTAISAIRVRGPAE